MQDDMTGGATPDVPGWSEREAPRHPPPERPPLPKPERLNRNALTIAAVMMGVLVLAAVIFLPTSQPPVDGARRATTPTAAEPTFLDRPVPGIGTRPSSAVTDPDVLAALDSVARAQAMDGSIGWGSPAWSNDGIAEPGADAPHRMTVSVGAHDTGVIERGSSVAGAPAVPSPGAVLDRRAAAYARALEAPTVRAARQDAGDDPGYDGAWSVDVENGFVAGVPPAALLSGGDAGSAAAGSGAHGVQDAPIIGREQFRAFLNDVRHSGTTAVQTVVEPAPGPYTVQAGTLVPAVLLTEVNSDLPGDVLAQVARNVYDSRTQQLLLIPKGARLLGRYHDQIGVGQDRLLLAWTRIIFPDGRSVRLPALPAVDREGAGGVRDQIDRHGRRAFGTATLLSLVGAGVQLSQPQQGAFAAPSAGQVAAAALGQQLSQVAIQLLQRELDVQPTIRIRQGVPFNVFLNMDLTFPGPYAPAP